MGFLIPTIGLLIVITLYNIPTLVDTTAHIYPSKGTPPMPTLGTKAL